MKLPGDTKWSLGSCVKALPNRSYKVEIAGRRYRRNRRQLRTTAEAPQHTRLEDLPNNDANEIDVTSPVNSQETTQQPIRRREETSGVTPELGTQPRRSTRVRKLPAWYDDYLMNY